jgi:hypothetical protein
MAVRLVKDFRLIDWNADRLPFCPDLSSLTAVLENKMAQFEISNAAHWSSLECFLNDNPEMSDPFSIFEQIYLKCQQVLVLHSAAPKILSVVLWIMVDMFQNRKLLARLSVPWQHLVELLLSRVSRESPPNCLVQTLLLLCLATKHCQSASVPSEFAFFLMESIKQRRTWVYECSAAIFKVLRCFLIRSECGKDLVPHFISLCFETFGHLDLVVHSLRALRKLMKVCRLSFNGAEIQRLVDCASAKNSRLVSEIFDIFAIYAAENRRQLLELNLLERIHDVPVLVYPQVKLGFVKLVSVMGEAGAEELQECLRIVNLADWFCGSYRQQ